MNLYHISHCVKNINNPTYISLGSNCCIAYHMQKFGLKNETFPFDWIETPCFLQLCKLINNDFNGMFSHFTINGSNYGPIIDKDWNEQKQIMMNIKNYKYNIIFKHDFTSILYPNRKNGFDIQKCYNIRIFEFFKIMRDSSKYKKLFRYGRADEQIKLSFLNDIFIKKGFSNYTIYLVPDNLSISKNVISEEIEGAIFTKATDCKEFTQSTEISIPIIDISQVDPLNESWKKSHYNWQAIFNCPLHNY